MTAQTREEGVGLPRPEGSARAEALAFASAPAEAGHLGVDEGLVQEHQPVRLLAHAGLTLLCPDPTLLTHVGACAFRRHQLFFYT